MAVPHICATAMIANRGNRGLGTITSFRQICLLSTEPGEGASDDRVALGIPFCMETEKGTINGIIF